MLQAGLHEVSTGVALKLTDREEWLVEIAKGVRPLLTKAKKDSPEPPKLSLEPSRLEGQRDDLKLPERCCKMMAEE
jgi:hypothetical protein